MVLPIEEKAVAVCKDLLAAVVLRLRSFLRLALGCHDAVIPVLRSEEQARRRAYR
jgi:hypothetical protein